MRLRVTIIVISLAWISCLSGADLRRRLLVAHGGAVQGGGASWTPTNTYGWWDPSDAGNIWTSNSNTQIFSMRDKSGNGFHAIANQISEAPTNMTISGRQYARFVTALGSKYVHTCSLTNNSTALVVVRVNETTAQRGIVVFTPVGNSFVEFYANVGAGVAATNWGYWIGSWKASSYRDDSFHILCNEADGQATGTGTNFLYTDQNVAESFSGTRQNAGVTRLFGSNPFSGGTTSMDLGEVIAYNRRLSENERTNCIAYLKAKWGTP